MNRLEMLRLVEEHYRSFWQGDLSDFDQQLSADFIDHESPPDAPRGPGPVEDFAAVMRPAFPDMTVNIDDAVVEGDLIAVRATWTGTNTGGAMGREPTGRRVAFSGMVFWRVEDGRIAERWAHVDTAAMWAQLEP